MRTRAGTLTSHQGGPRWWGRSHDTPCLLGEQGSHDTANAGGGVTIEGEWQEAVIDQYKICYSCSGQNLGPEGVSLHFP